MNASIVFLRILADCIGRSIITGLAVSLVLGLVTLLLVRPAEANTPVACYPFDVIRSDGPLHYLVLATALPGPPEYAATSSPSLTPVSIGITRIKLCTHC